MAGFLASGFLVPPVWGSAPAMVEIPGGPFIQGAPSHALPDIRPGVHLNIFFIDTHEVTNAAFSEKFPDHTFWPGAESHPVSQITWHQAQEYCRLSGKRLPTENEWEKSARGPKGQDLSLG